MISFDQATDCPKRDKKHSLEILNFYQMQAIEIQTSDEYKSLIKELYQNRELLDEVTQKEIEYEYKSLIKVEKIPTDELYKHYENTSKCGYFWETARSDANYDEFEKELEELVNFNKKYIKWQEQPNIKGYSVLLDEMEEGYTEEMYDDFFYSIEKVLVPFIKKIFSAPKKYNPKLDTLSFPIEKQKQLTKFIADMMEYTDEVGCIRETIHPFTNWANNNDVRITTSYDENLLFSNLYSVMHEIGHALFQLQMDSKYNGTCLFNSVTCATHESQSRFYENYLGRSRSFVKFLYPKLMELFPNELADITEDDIYYYINSSYPQFTRTEADELTYPLHVLIRYKVEKALFNDEIGVKNIDKTFNKYMEQYLGITPKNKLIGCYQDVHWSSGFGYFPTYALGSAFGAMFLDAMKKDLDVDSLLEKGDFKPINAWLKEHIHQYAGTRKNLEVVKAVCGKDFDVNVYLNYLIDKFSKIYL